MSKFSSGHWYWYLERYRVHVERVTRCKGLAECCVSQTVPLVAILSLANASTPNRTGSHWVWLHGFPQYLTCQDGVVCRCCTDHPVERGDMWGSTTSGTTWDSRSRGQWSATEILPVGRASRKWYHDSQHSLWRQWWFTITKTLCGTNFSMIYKQGLLLACRQLLNIRLLKWHLFYKKAL